MTELLEELAADLGPGRIFRPYRDIRFSKDKSPYKTAIGARVGDGYVQLSARGLAAGNGMYAMAPDQLERYRQAVADDLTGPQLERVIAAVRACDIDVHGHENAEDRAARLPGRPSPDRPAALQGADRVEGMAGAGLAGHRGGRGSACASSWPRPSRWPTGWPTTSARPSWPSPAPLARDSRPGKPAARR